MAQQPQPSPEVDPPRQLSEDPRVCRFENEVELVISDIEHLIHKYRFPHESVGSELRSAISKLEDAVGECDRYASQLGWPEDEEKGDG